MTLSRRCRRILLLIGVLCFAATGPVYAQSADRLPSVDGIGDTDSPPADLYTAPERDSMGMGIPSGAMYLKPASQDKTAKPFTTTPTATGDTTNFLGCGGVGQGDYTTALYNMPEVFGKFQQDVNSTLAKQILTMNYSMPQTAALFDTLNTYGNQRYLQFQQGCSLDALKQDAKQQYLTACMTADMIAKRKQIVKTAMSSSGSNNTTEDMLNTMAYAQASEICSMQYVSDTIALAARKDTNKAFAEGIRKTENINTAIKTLLCPPGESADDKACWPALLIPQVRMCLDSSLEGGCGDGKEYGVREALIPMTRLFDALRFLMDDTIIARRVVPLNQQIDKAGLTSAARRLAASEAALALSAGSLTRNSSGGADMATNISGGDWSAGNSRSFASIPEATKPFVAGYLNCKDSDIFRSLKSYAYYLNKPSYTSDPQAGTTISVTTPVDTDYEKTLTRFKVDGIEDADIKDISYLAQISLACTTNQTIPIFDPNITASLSIQCSPLDRTAFYSMAGNDVAMTATRDIYRYLSLRLKQVYGRLISQGLVPADAAAAGSTAAASSTIISPELNRRLANAVKEIMIPSVEAQIERLDEISKSRGEFAQRVQQIYSNKQGCMSSPATLSPRDLRARGGAG